MNVFIRYVFIVITNMNFWCTFSEVLQRSSDVDGFPGSVIHVKEEKVEDKAIEGDMDDVTTTENRPVENPSDGIAIEACDVISETSECPSENLKGPGPSEMVKVEVMPHFLEIERYIDVEAAPDEKILSCSSTIVMLNSQKPSIAVNKRVVCDICGATFGRHDNFKRHMLVHTGETRQCDICSYQTTKPHNFKRHMLAHSEENRHMCPVCDKRFSGSCVLRKHMIIHTGKKPYECDVCSYRCSRADHLRVHMQTHTGEKKFACEVCNYRCSQSNDLKRHMRKHTGEKPFTCEFCDYKCCEASALKNHVRTHTDERPFSCDVCVYSCRRAGDLKVHMMIHTGEKPFECEVCNYKTNQSSILLRHKRTHAEFEQMDVTADGSVLS